MKSITVFCASSPGFSAVYMEQAYLVGKTLAEKGIRLIYGGANIGLMGAVADGALEAGGEVVGVLPDFLRAKEIAHRRLSELIMVETMHERKTKMNDLCDGVIALPGGYGTLEELFEMITWAQLGLHQKPIALLNINGYYDHLTKLLQHMTDEGLLKAENQRMLLSGTDIHQLLEQMKQYTPPLVGKWITKDEL
ncbi:TIGR00730 family Rossman fold protein [Chitinophaga barathri]|uniref:Cytokinin riboside 5'-monophosphate phosphoribohydrolase n=1 Tax=Chitinophaga barathri TaxID=1647451 RepID=A0A3N4MFC4_9BACT|nr:TIGR00730 family Rossman fold protein [Chitinophaga barathri]RPD42712.1 TIGR00730 family Rossman fold protein [Chitinophaga barathri]